MGLFSFLHLPILSNFFMSKVTIEGLQAELESSQKALADAKKKITELSELGKSATDKEKQYLIQLEDLKQSLETAAGENKELLQKVEDLENKNTEAEGAITELKTQVSDLEKKLESKKDTTAVPSFERDGKTYEVLGKVNIPDIGILTALEIANHPAAQNFLVEKGSGMIKEVV